MSSAIAARATINLNDLQRQRTYRMMAA